MRRTTHYNNDGSDPLTLVGRWVEKENRNHLHDIDNNDPFGKWGEWRRGLWFQRNRAKVGVLFRETGQVSKARKVQVLSLKINISETPKDLDKCEIGIG